MCEFQSRVRWRDPGALARPWALDYNRVAVGKRRNFKTHASGYDDTVNRRVSRRQGLSDGI